MPEYFYKAKTRSGKTVQGKQAGANKNEVKAALHTRGLRPMVIRLHVMKGAVDISDEPGPLPFLGRDVKGNLTIKIGDDLPSTKELAVFTKQFSLMVSNGVDMIRCLDLLQQQQQRMGFKKIIKKITNLVQNGANLSDAMEVYPKVFDALYVALIRAGEASGKLDIIMKQLVIYIEKAAKIKSQIRSAMMYPIIVVFVAVGVVSILLIFVVPQIAQQFMESGKELPGITQLVIDASNLLKHNIAQILIALVGVGLAFKAWIDTPKGRARFDAALLKAPIIGDVVTKISVGRFCSTMSTMLSSGVQILQALDICAASSGNVVVEKFVLRVREEISKGRSFSEPLGESNFIPSMVVSMVSVGETSGTLDETLAKVTEIYDEEVDSAIAAMTSMIEPILLVVIGSVVGFIVIAMYLPIFDMASTVG